MNGTGDEHHRVTDDGALAMPRVPGLVMLRRLGRGAHGEVWLAAELTSGERVAVKVHRSSTAGRAGGGRPPAAGDGATGDAATRLDREIALLRRIDHPHVVRLRRVVDLPDGGRALVMDLAGGGSLADLVAVRGPLDPPEACTVVVPLAQTLSELHGRGLVHGDLAPGNVVFGADGRPMIADLGCAVVLGERSDQVWGSDGYVDPGRTGRAEPAHDVYALGALLRFALTGSPSPGPGGGVLAPGRDDPRSWALLALADRCTGPQAGRPGPPDVARAALDTTPAAPVRLLSASAPAGTEGVRSSAAAHGWTRPADGQVRPADRPLRAGGRAAPSPGAQAPTAATILPVTAVDLDLDVGLAAPAVRLRPSPSPSGSGPSAVTRRRPLPTGSSPEAAGAGRRGDRSRRGGGRVAGRGLAGDGGARGAGGLPGRRAQHQRATAADGALSSSAAGSRRGVLLVAAAVLVVSGAAWWMLGVLRPPAPTSSAPVAARPSPSVARLPDGPSSGALSSGTVGASPGGDVAESLEAAVVRLARSRAAAFGAATVQPLIRVDEPGSAALAVDTALVARLRAQGLRLEGLSFEVSGVHRTGSDGAAVTVVATVVSSAHRQVSLSDGSVRATVPASGPRQVVLTLALGADGRQWLVRSVRSEVPSAVAP